MLPNGFKQSINKPSSSDPTNTNDDTKHNSNEINLIDFENLQITQKRDIDIKKKELEDKQIKMIEDFMKTCSKTNQAAKDYSTTITDAEFQAFFDNREFDHKPTYKLTRDDLLLLESKSSGIEEKSQFNLITKIPITNNPPSTSSFTTTKLKEQEDLDVEDLVDEIMTHQILEKQLRVEQIPKLHNHKPSQEVNFMSLAQKRDRIYESEVNNDENIYDKILAQNVIIRSDVNEKHFVKINKPTEESITEKSFESKNKIDQKALIEELVTKYDIKYLETVKKIDKVFAKCCDLKSDAEKSRLTLGPSLYEKSVVLPQIMQRLRKRDKATAPVKEIEMKLILDVPGTSATKPIHTSQVPNKNQITNNEKQSLTKLSASKDSKENINSSILMLNPPKLLNSNPIILKTPKVTSLKPNLLNVRPNISQSAKLTVPNSSKDKQTALSEQPDIIKSINEKPQSHLDNKIPVLRPPELLMEDCNKERLKAFVTRKLYDSIINGKF